MSEVDFKDNLGNLPEPYDPGMESVELNRAEKRRATALMMAINAYSQMIIKDSGMLREAADIARRGEGPKLSPASINEMVDAAVKFERFIATGSGMPAAERISDQLEGEFEDDPPAIMQPPPPESDK